MKKIKIKKRLTKCLMISDLLMTQFELNEIILFIIIWYRQFINVKINILGCNIRVGTSYRTKAGRKLSYFFIQNALKSTTRDRKLSYFLSYHGTIERYNGATPKYDDNLRSF